MIEQCFNMVGGDCISQLHMTLFIFALVIIGVAAGFGAGQAYEEYRVRKQQVNQT